nr:immunoglobulin heavy chain junction region [Mus musculus]
CARPGIYYGNFFAYW